MRLLSIAALAWLALAPLARAQSTGAQFPTPSGQFVPGSAVLVPSGPIVNGQPSYSPPGPTDPLAVQCQNCQVSGPIGASSNPVSGTIAATGTFQVLLTQNAARKGCHIQNQGAHIEYFSDQASPTEGGSVQVLPGNFYDCAATTTGVVRTDTIQVAGTAGDAFAGDWQ